MPTLTATMASVLVEQGRLDEAISACRVAIRLNPEARDPYINLLFALYHQPDSDSRRLLEETRQWARCQSGDSPVYLPTRDRNPERRLRIGYLSQFFQMCADAHFILPLMAHHDRNQFEIFCYTKTTGDDELADRLRGAQRSLAPNPRPGRSGGGRVDPRSPARHSGQHKPARG